MSSIAEQLRMAEERKHIILGEVKETETIESSKLIEARATARATEIATATAIVSSNPLSVSLVNELLDTKDEQEESKEEEQSQDKTQKEIDENVIPKLVFIVPYRDREQQQIFFKQHMKMVLEDMSPNEYKIYYIHQQDNREFNRGAMKNIGFLMVKDKYPNDYKNITLVFNDIDTMPFTKNFLNYDTVAGNIKHFYGVMFALGGIVSIKGSDFETLTGFPNFWAWGFEDNLLYKRALQTKINVDRSQFYPLMDKNIFQMKDGLSRLVNRAEFDKYMNDTNDGLQNIRDLQYNINEETGFVNVTNFNTGQNPNSEKNTIHDLRKGSKPFPLQVKQPPITQSLMSPAGIKRGKPKFSMNF